MPVIGRIIDMHSIFLESLHQKRKNNVDGSCLSQLSSVFKILQILFLQILQIIL